MTDAHLAAAIAEEAGRLLLNIQRDSGLTGRGLGDAGDKRANELILARLGAARPDDAILSEESRDDLSRLGAKRVWIVDPLDGTREFREGRNDWAVHIGLSVAELPVAGAIAIPSEGLIFTSDNPPALQPVAARSRIITSRSRPAPVAAFAAERMGAELIDMGSAGAKAAAVLTGNAEAYLHSGAQKEWDNCAPVAVALAAGLHCSRLDGSPLRYNRADVVVPDLLICRRELSEPLIAAAAAFSRSNSA